MRFNTIFIACVFSIAILFACQSPSADKSFISEDSLRVHLEHANKIRVHQESEEIDDFVNRHQFKVERTGTGLRIDIYHQGTGKKYPAIHDEVIIAGKVFLLDGTLCYTIDSLKPVQFNIGEGKSSNGLEEGLMKMVEGDMAHLIVPVHLGYGLSGDGDKIPPGVAIYYDVQLLKVNK